MPRAARIIDVRPALAAGEEPFETIMEAVAGLEDDRRCRLHVADVVEVLAGRVGPPGEWDVVLLDVDNGRGFLIRPANAVLYTASWLTAALGRVAPGGALVVAALYIAVGSALDLVLTDPILDLDLR